MHYSLKELHISEKYCSYIINKIKYQINGISLKYFLKEKKYNLDVYITAWKYNKLYVSRVSHSKL